MSTRQPTRRPARHQALSATGKLQPIVMPGAFRRAVARLFRRPQVTMFHRCLAVHLYHVGPRSALD